MSLEIKKINLDEIDRVMVIINDAKRLLGNHSLQWQQGYPNEETMKADIVNNDLYGCYINSTLVGIVALVQGLNINYTEIYEGSWIKETSDDDLVIHRIAVKEEFHKMKIGQALMEFAEKYAKEKGKTSIKIDTHVKNIPMQTLCKNNGYEYRGIIYLKRAEVDNSRLAFEKTI
ncbi:MAG: GNAT family N-acetyltransferase [Bacilli bacterium]|nr:GNAT family N-acetyltransferase [Bacilli bacterium]